MRKRWYLTLASGLATLAIIGMVLSALLLPVTPALASAGDEACDGSCNGKADGTCENSTSDPCNGEGCGCSGDGHSADACKCKT